MGAPAPNSAATLEWQAPDGCPTGEDVQAEIARFTAAGGGGAGGSATAVVVPSEEGFTLTLAVDDQPPRTIEAPVCETLAAAAALVIAVSRDPVATAEAVSVLPAQTQPQQLELPPPVPTQVEPVFVPANRALPPPRERPLPFESRGFVRPEAGFSAGVLPGIGAGFGLAIGIIGRAPWRAELGGAYYLPRFAAASDNREIGAPLFYAGVVARGCGEPRLRRVSFPLCAGLELGGVGGRGEGPAIEGSTGSALYVGIPFGGGVAWSPLRRFAVVVRGEAVIGARRPAFHIDRVGPAHRAEAVAGRGFAGIELRFP